MIIREANENDREFILNAHREINGVSGLDDSEFENNIDKDLFKDKVLKSIIAEIDGKPVGLLLYSYMYWTNCGRGIYLSQAFVKSDYRGQGIYKQLLTELENKEKECTFITNLVGDENTTMMNVLNKLEFKSSKLITYYKRITKKEV